MDGVLWNTGFLSLQYDHGPSPGECSFAGRASDGGDCGLYLSALLWLYRDPPGAEASFSTDRDLWIRDRFPGDLHISPAGNAGRIFLYFQQLSCGLGEEAEHSMNKIEV